MKGYKIGKGVTIAFGSVVCGEEVSIGDHTSIGLFTIIRGKKIVIGPHVTIGSTTFLDTPFLEIGEESKINEQVFIGGLQDPDSKFVLGKNCQILQLCYINPAKYITIGDNSAIGGNSLIFGHASWLSEFDGYPVTFAPIELGNNVSVSWKVFILPGVKIGDGALIGANSLVNRNIPPRCLASGFPAKVISREPIFPKVPTRNEKILFLENIIREMMLYLQKSGLECNRVSANAYSITFRCKKLFRTIQTTWKMRVVYHEEQLINVGEINDVDVLISLPELSEEWRRKLIRSRVAWIDIEKRQRSDTHAAFCEEVVQYLRRYGLRFLRWQE